MVREMLITALLRNSTLPLGCEVGMELMMCCTPGKSIVIDFFGMSMHEAVLNCTRASLPSIVVALNIMPLLNVFDIGINVYWLLNVDCERS